MMLRRRNRRSLVVLSTVSVALGVVCGAGMVGDGTAFAGPGASEKGAVGGCGAGSAKGAAKGAAGRAGKAAGAGVCAPQEKGRAARRREAPTLTRARLARMETTKSGRFVVPLGDGEGAARAELTIDGRVQRLAERVLKQHGTPYGAAVVMSVADGRVLAMAGRSPEPEATAAELCTTPWAPAASVFKLVTAAALLATGVKPSEKVCYHGGIRSVDPSNLVDDPKRDRDCRSLAYGLAKSQNAIVARFTVDNLQVSSLASMARAFFFGERLPGDVAAAPSEAQIPADPLSFARVAAGFWRTTLSPLHGALIAATIARGGTTPPVRLVSKVVDERGVSTEVEAAAPERRVLDEELAKTLGKMMVGTTNFGTAYRSFHDKEGRSTLRGVPVAGKTGTLTRRTGDYLLYSWFVGFAPAHKPKVAFAVLLGNGPERYVRAHQVARDLLHGFFRSKAAAGMLIASR